MPLISPLEAEALAELAAQVPEDQAIVEIGSYLGDSALALASRSKSEIHCVDLWTDGGQPHEDKYADPSVYETFIERTSHLNITPHRGASLDIAATWNGPTIGLLFIDGEHTYQAVTQDLEAWLPHCADDAWVAFHDYCERYPGVIQAVDEWLDGRVARYDERLVSICRG